MFILIIKLVILAAIAYIVRLVPIFPEWVKTAVSVVCGVIAFAWILQFLFAVLAIAI